MVSPSMDGYRFEFRFGSGPGIRTLNLAVNKSLQPVQKWSLDFAEYRRVPSFATVFRRRCCTRTPVHSPSASRRPASTCSIFKPSRLPRRLLKSLLSSVTTCVTLMTESRSKPAVPAARATLPGAAPNLRFEVMAATVTVLIRERLKASAEITRTGRRQAGADPCRGPRSAHQTSPRTTTSRRLLSSVQQPAGDRATSPQPCRRLPEPW